MYQFLPLYAYVQQLLKDPEASDWERYDMYARHVQIVYFGTVVAKLKPTNQLYEHLARLSKTHALLPSLRQLYWWLREGDTDLDHVSAFIGLSVTSFELGMQKDKDMNCFLPDLPRLCPNLEEFRMIAYSMSNTTQTILADTLSSLPKLKIFQIRNASQATITTEIMQRLSQSPHLRFLSLEGHSFVPGAEGTSRLSGPAQSFNTLRALELRAAHALQTDWQQVLRPYYFPGLECLKLFTNREESEGLSRLLQILDAHVPPSLLRVLDVQEGWDAAQVVGHQNLDPNILEPLQLFTNLTDLAFSPWRGIAWTDDSLVQFVRAFPSLRHLNLSLGPLVQTPVLSTRPTLDVLAPLINVCPNLRTLALTIHASKVPVNTDDLPRNDKLVSLKLTHSLMNEQIDFRDVARFLHTLFPSLPADKVQYDNGPYGPSTESWKHVEKQLKKIQDRSSLVRLCLGSNWHSSNGC